MRGPFTTEIQHLNYTAQNIKPHFTKQYKQSKINKAYQTPSEIQESRPAGEQKTIFSFFYKFEKIWIRSIYLGFLQIFEKF